jgi:hypothetical protein
VIDLGAYAHMRNLQGRFNEIDIGSTDAKERMRSSPVLGLEDFNQLWQTAPLDTEKALLAEPEPT